MYEKHMLDEIYNFNDDDAIRGIDAHTNNNYILHSIIS